MKISPRFLGGVESISVPGHSDYLKIKPAIRKIAGVIGGSQRPYEADKGNSEVLKRLWNTRSTVVLDVTLALKPILERNTLKEKGYKSQGLVSSCGKHYGPHDSSRRARMPLHRGRASFWLVIVFRFLLSCGYNGYEGPWST